MCIILHVILDAVLWVGVFILGKSWLRIHRQLSANVINKPLPEFEQKRCCYVWNAQQKRKFTIVLQMIPYSNRIHTKTANVYF
jgi:hypothetical protein